MALCTECGRSTAHFARGLSSNRTVSDRLLIYEGYSPKGIPFTYKDTGVCFYCRAAKNRRRKSQGNIHGLSAVKSLLWEMNRRKDGEEAG